MFSRIWGPMKKLKPMNACGIATSARIEDAIFFCHSSDRSVAAARSRILRRVARGVASHAGKARCAASMAARQSSEEAAAEVDVMRPVCGLGTENVAPVLAGRRSPSIRRGTKGISVILVGGVRMQIDVGMLDAEWCLVL